MPRFSLGQVLATPGALVALGAAGQTGLEFLNRHQSGDWGDVDEEARQENECPIIQHHPLWSMYHTAKGVKLLVFTEADRSATTILLPEEY